MGFILFSRKKEQEAKAVIKREVGNLLSKQFGPAPWALEGRKSGIYTDGEELVWMESKAYSSIKLYSPKKRRTYFILGGGGFVDVLDPQTFLSINANAGRMEYALFSMADIKPILHPEVVAKEVATKRRPYGSAAKPVAKFWFNRNLDAGVHVLEKSGDNTMLETMLQSRELLTIYITSNKAIAKKLANHQYCLGIVNFKKQNVEIVPQTWFSGGSWDHEYVWLARAARDQKTKNIYIEGVRMGVAEFDKHCLKFKSWVKKDNFHEIGSMDFTGEVMAV